MGLQPLLPSVSSVGRNQNSLLPTEPPALCLSCKSKTHLKKRIKRDRSRDTFKMRLGMGTVLEESGDGLAEKASGSSLLSTAFH